MARLLMNYLHQCYRSTCIYAVSIFTDTLEYKTNKESSSACKLSIQTTGIHPVAVAITINNSQ